RECRFCHEIHANGCKISGNAQYISGKRIVSHGTLLFDVDMTILSKALNPNKIKFESKGIKSIRSRVTKKKTIVIIRWVLFAFLSAFSSSRLVRSLNFFLFRI
ncbi:lipoate--protein ligase family protein, partial [Mycoplasmopsis bovis]|uniref:lipoate--protein ligase family protein n=1 Tax=Mycoplasmopsis bovis TaxID=28903 RepID=UPI003D2AF50D